MKRAKVPTMLSLQQLALDAYSDTPDPFGVQVEVRDGTAKVLLIRDSGSLRGEFMVIRAGTDDQAKRALHAALVELGRGRKP